MKSCKYIGGKEKSARKQLLFNPLNTELNSICHLLELLGSHHILHIGWVRVNAQNIQETDSTMTFLPIINFLLQTLVRLV